MDFPGALAQVKVGAKVRRIGWNGRGMWLYKVWGSSVAVDGKSVTVEPFLLMKTADDKYVPWLASQTDLLADDWTTA